MKRTCGRVRARMTRLLDRELPPSEQREVEEHLDSCADCRAEVAQLRAMGALLRSVATIRSEAGERSAILTAAAAYPEGRRGGLGWVEWARSIRPGDWLTVGAAAAAAVLAVFLAEERRALQTYESWPSSSTVLTTAESEARERGVRIEARETLSIVDPLGSGSRDSGIGRSS